MSVATLGSIANNFSTVASAATRGMGMIARTAGMMITVGALSDMATNDKAPAEDRFGKKLIGLLFGGWLTSGFGGAVAQGSVARGSLAAAVPSRVPAFRATL